MSNASNTRDKHREHLLSARRVSFEQFDKAILTLSSGGLAVSLTFLKGIWPISVVTDYTFLIWSWKLFVAAIISTVLSFITSQKAHDVELEALETHKQKAQQGSKTKRFFKRTWKSKNWFSATTRVLNLFSVACFIAAIILTVHFASENLPKEGTLMSGDEKLRGKTAGIVPPRMQETPPEGEPQQEGIVPPTRPETPTPEPPTPESPVPDPGGGDNGGGSETDQ